MQMILKNYIELLLLNKALKATFEKKRNEVKQCADTHIVVVGAGLSGVEIAAEMAYYSNKFFKRGNFSCDNLKISLISSSSSILPGLKQDLINISQKKIKRFRNQCNYRNQTSRSRRWLL